ncbi:LysR substrate-binding domain-containing protein [Curvibacter sp. HBC28]|uniref:LysR substrate-binding domain-containing protein n=1 Tax=Curvibacter microcysteis TaxID=3026419 RepID=A0ABT5MKN7_9BURK|nr:LysR substrate-binding domain-containing protein [Curvibacter sp. HBC28]MDD0816940.1 LysR substrate-binding domain-containing protein [Curvibacter sp. HBC28]
MLDPAIEWNDLFLFSQVVEKRGFTAAGEALGIPKSRISRRVAHLETQLNTRLLNRNSRRLSLTEAGQVLHAHCLAMVEEAHAGVEALRHRLERPVGKVRLSLPLALAELMASEVLPRFMTQCPEVQLEVLATNRSLDLIEEQIDVVVRGVGVEPWFHSSSLVQACVCTAPWALVCSPDYLQKRGPLDTLASLSAADTLLYGPQRKPAEAQMRLIGATGQIEALPIAIRLQSDNLSVLRQAALAGLGVCGLPLYVCRDDLHAGRLCTVLPAWKPQAGHLVVLFPSRRGLSAAARALIEFLKQALPPLMEGV